MSRPVICKRRTLLHGVLLFLLVTSINKNLRMVGGTHRQSVVFKMFVKLFLFSSPQLLPTKEKRFAFFCSKISEKKSGKSQGFAHFFTVKWSTDHCGTIQWQPKWWGKTWPSATSSTRNSIAYLLPGLRGERPATMSQGTTFSYQFI